MSNRRLPVPRAQGHGAVCPTQSEGMRSGRHTVDLVVVAGAMGLSAGQLNGVLGPVASINQVALAGLYFVGLLLLALNWHHAVPVAARGAPLWLLLGYLFLSIAWSGFPTHTFLRSLALLCATLFGLYAAIRLNDRDVIACTAVGLCAMLVVSLLFAVFFPSHGLMQAPHEGALRGIFSQKNTLARAAVWSTIALVILRPATRAGRGLRVLGLAISILSLLWASSRTGLVVLVLLLLILAFSRSLAGTTRLAAVPAALVAVVIAAVLGYAVVTNRSALLELIGRDVTLTGRTLIWVRVAELIRLRPLLGYGYGGFWHGWDGPSWSVWALGIWNPNDSHNGFLDLVLDLGLVGLVVFGCVLAHAALKAIGRLRQSSELSAAWPLIVLTGFVLYNITESAILRPTNIMWLLFCTALFGCYRSRRCAAGTEPLTHSRHPLRSTNAS